MTVEPTHLSQGINYLGFLAQQIGDLQGIKSLAHELIQNADDAKNEEGNFAAREIVFDVTDEALVITNDAIFREVDFERMRDVAAGAKRDESGSRTTGAFGVGFISVYQVTDHPEIFSAGRRWVFHPEAQEANRIQVYPDQSVRGTLFRLPWAFHNSELRQKLRADPLEQSDLDLFESELSDTLPATIIFLKSLQRIELRRNGRLITVVKRIRYSDQIIVEENNESTAWILIEGDFSKEGDERKRFSPRIERNRSPTFQIAIPDSKLKNGLLYATLPTEQFTGLPFHLNADFFPESDRKAIVFGSDYRAEWNRAAIRATASTLGSNLEVLLDVFRRDPETFWFFLERLHHVSMEHANDTRQPFDLFWRELSASLPSNSVVFTESKRWLPPSEVRIPTGQEQEQAVPVLAALGIETVHPDLRHEYRNLLTSREVGVQSIRAADIHEALARLKLVDEPAVVDSMPESYRSEEGVRAFWRAIEAVIDQSRPNINQAENLLADCTLAPSADDNLWPFYQAFRATEDTVSLFSPLLPNISFLLTSFVEDPLAKRLCPLFTAADAIEELASLTTIELEDAWQRDKLLPAQLLHWFEEHSAELSSNAKLSSELSALPVFPSGKKLRSLTDLALPGDFTDELGLSELVDIDQLRGLGDFLRRLGARQLTFREYAKRFIPEAFLDRDLDPEKKRKVVSLLIRNLGAVREDSEARRALSIVAVVECQDGVWRAPSDVYLDTDDVRLIFGPSAYYALLPEAARESTYDFYEWLGAATAARPSDILAVIDDLTAEPPNVRTKRAIAAIVESLGRIFPSFAPEDQEQFTSLKTKPWLPADGDLTSWHHSTDLFATFRKYIFSSQGTWLDVPLLGQQAAVAFLRWLGVKNEPTVQLVVQHLMKSASDGMPVNEEVYSFLNGPDVTDAELEPLRSIACLLMGGHYVRPDHAFWGPHVFGRFRVSLGQDLMRFGKFLDAVGVRQVPEYSDAILVLQEIAEDRRDQPLGPDHDIVMQCWLLLSDSLQSGTISAEDIESRLRSTKSIPNKRDLLCWPGSVYFEDRPGLAEKFQAILENCTIVRPERAWPGMTAAGVMPVSEVVFALLQEAIGASENAGLRRRVQERRLLIKSISDGGTAASPKPLIPLEELRFIEASEVHIQWTLNAFEYATSGIELADAYLDREERKIYFSRRGDEPPWSAIARELAQAIAPGVEVRTISPGLKTILQAADEAEAQAELDDLGIASIHEVDLGAQALTSTVNAFDSLPGEDEHWDEAFAFEGEGPGGLPQSPPGNGSEQPSESPFNTFMQRLFEAQALDVTLASDIPAQLPIAGPNTEASATQHTEESIEFGRSGDHVRRSVTWWRPRPAAQLLADEFRAMALGDYSKRCQICSRTFSMPNGEPQAFVIHLVEPSKDPATNHFGNLVSLCGWHYALVQYGRWKFIDPQTGQAPATQAQLRQLLLRAERKIDGTGNDYYSVPIRFSDVYENWNSSPLTQNEELRYSEPHWIYLRELLGSEPVI